MGKIKNNIVTKGFSGKLGEDITFRQFEGKTIFAKRTLTSAAPSERQQEVRNRFSEATQYAAAAVENPHALLDYKAMAEELGLSSAYVAAISDYLMAPEIGGVFTVHYKGKIGDVINITSKVLVKLIDVEVSIFQADGTLLESGKAVASNLKWKYVATAVNPQVKGSKLVIAGRDRQDRETKFEKLL